MSIIPPARPEMSRADAVKLLAQQGVSVARAPALLGRRGYYRDTMGAKGTNDRGIFDDAIMLVGPDLFIAFNANTDPSVYRDGLASLVPGVYEYKWGTHHPGTPNAYRCLVQAGPVTVKRDHGVTESGEFYIHIHRGSEHGTSSLGCQTIPKSQWDDFETLTSAAMTKWDTTRILYCLTARPDDV